jgi:hypothetical protein
MQGGRCGWAARQAGRTHSRLRWRDGQRHGPLIIPTVAARAVGWRSEMSAASRPHGPARCVRLSFGEKLFSSRCRPHQCCWCRKSNRIAPFYYVFNPLALIDFVDQFRGVIHKPHCRLARHTGPPQPVHISDPQAVETQVFFLDFDEELLPSA